jgi:hypothetical protein
MAFSLIDTFFETNGDSIEDVEPLEDASTFLDWSGFFETLFVSLELFFKAWGAIFSTTSEEKSTVKLEVIDFSKSTDFGETTTLLLLPTGTILSFDITKFSPNGHFREFMTTPLSPP